MTVTRAGRGPRAASLLLVCLVSALLVAAVAGSDPAAAAEGELTAEELGLRVETGFGGMTARRAWVPVSVFMAPDRAFEGRLRVVVNHEAGRQAAVEDIEVPAGSVKVFRFLVPPAEGVEVQAVPRGGGRGVTVRGPTQPTREYLVGVLGERIPDDAPPLRAYALDLTGRYVEVDPAWLEHPGALTSLSGVVAGQNRLQGLSETQRRTLAAEVVAGLDLVVVPEAAGPVDLDPLDLPTPATAVRADGALTEAWAVEPQEDTWVVQASDVLEGAPEVPLAAAAPAGLGRVIVSGARFGSGELGSHGPYWGLLVQPTGRSGGTLTSDASFGMLSNVAEGLRSSTLELPPLGWFVLFLLAYVVVVGPVNGFVLVRAGRRELAWITVPAVTLVFAAGAWVTSADQSSSLGIAGRAAYWIDGHGSEVVATALRAPRADEHRLTLEGGRWSVLAGSWSSAADVRTAADEVTVDLQLEALQVGNVVARRPTLTEPPLAVQARVVGDDVLVDVTNRSSTLLDDVMVRAGTARDRFGPLAPGETVTHTLATPGTLPVEQAWHDPFAGVRAPDGTLEAPRSLESLLRFDVLDGNPGIVWITGTFAAGHEPLPVLTGGTRAADQGVFVAVGVTPQRSDAHVSPFEVGRRLITTGFGGASQPGPLAIEGQTEAVLRYRLPTNGDVAELTSTLERGQLETGHFEEAHACTLEDMPEGRTRELCGPERLLPLLEATCPDDALQCSLEGQQLFVCPENAPCEHRPIPQRLAEAIAEQEAGAMVGAGGLEVYDRLERAWLPVAEVFPDGTATDPDAYVSPLGEVFVRVSGELFPFDFSGRGIGGRLRS